MVLWAAAHHVWTAPAHLGSTPVGVVVHLLLMVRVVLLMGSRHHVHPGPHAHGHAGVGVHRPHRTAAHVVVGVHAAAHGGSPRSHGGHTVWNLILLLLLSIVLLLLLHMRMRMGVHLVWLHLLLVWLLLHLLLLLLLLLLLMVTPGTANLMVLPLLGHELELLGGVHVARAHGSILRGLHATRIVHTVAVATITLLLLLL